MGLVDREHGVVVDATESSLPCTLPLSKVRLLYIICTCRWFKEVDIDDAAAAADETCKLDTGLNALTILQSCFLILQLLLYAVLAQVARRKLQSLPYGAPFAAAVRCAGPPQAAEPATSLPAAAAAAAAHTDQPQSKCMHASQHMSLRTLCILPGCAGQYRVSNIELRVQFKTKLVVIIFSIVCMSVLW